MSAALLCHSLGWKSVKLVKVSLLFWVSADGRCARSCRANAYLRDKWWLLINTRGKELCQVMTKCLSSCPLKKYKDIHVWFCRVSESKDKCKERKGCQGELKAGGSSFSSFSSFILKRYSSWTNLFSWEANKEIFMRSSPSL